MANPIVAPSDQTPIAGNAPPTRTWLSFFQSVCWRLLLVSPNAGLAVYANNAAAILAGLPVGAFYRTGADPDHVCVVH